MASDKSSLSWQELFFRIGAKASAGGGTTEVRLDQFPATTTVTVDSVLGFKLSGETHNAIIRQMLLTDGRLPYEPLVTFLTLVAGRLGGTYLDIGANLGYCSVLAASCAGAPLSVHAFEPSLPNFYWLRKNIAENGLGRAVTPYLVGLGAEDGSASLSDYGTGSSFVRGWDDGAGDALGLREGPVRRLDALVDDAMLATPTFVKVDVEGYELEVLLGARDTLSNPKVACVLCEIGHGHHPEGHNPNAAASIETLESYGYDCFGLSVIQQSEAAATRVQATPAAHADPGKDAAASWPNLWLAIRREDPSGAGRQFLGSLALFPMFLQLYPAPVDVLEQVLGDMA